MRIATLLVLGVLIGCSTDKTMDNKTAAEAVQSQLKTKHSVIFTQIGRVGSDCVSVSQDGQETPIDLTPTANIDILTAVAAGYISVAPDGPGFWKIAPTEQAKGDVEASREMFFAQPARKGCDYRIVEFVIANPELVKVTGVTADENAPEVPVAHVLSREYVRKSSKNFVRALTIYPGVDVSFTWKIGS